ECSRVRVYWSCVDRHCSAHCLPSLCCCDHHVINDVGSIEYMVIVDVAFQGVDTQKVIQTISSRTVTGGGSLCNTKTCLGSSQCCVTPVIRRYGLSRISTLPSNWPKI